jgi:hypothetical protein
MATGQARDEHVQYTIYGHIYLLDSLSRKSLVVILPAWTFFVLDPACNGPKITSKHSPQIIPFPNVTDSTERTKNNLCASYVVVSSLVFAQLPKRPKSKLPKSTTGLPYIYTQKSYTYKSLFDFKLNAIAQSQKL